MPKSGLTEADWDRITNLIFTAVKPINDRLINIENRLEAIENCLTIKKELKK